MTVMTQCDARYEYANMQNLTEFDLSYPTIIDCVEALTKRRCIKKIDTGGICLLRVSEEFRYLVDHLRKIPNQLMLLPEDPEPVNAKWWTKKDQDDVIRFYAIEKDIPTDKIQEWNRANYRANIKAAQWLLDYCGSLSAARLTITNCRIERSKKKLDWSLAGDVRRNIQKYAPKLDHKGGKQWN